MYDERDVRYGNRLYVTEGAQGNPLQSPSEIAELLKPDVGTLLLIMQLFLYFHCLQSISARTLATMLAAPVADVKPGATACRHEAQHQ